MIHSFNVFCKVRGQSRPRVSYDRRRTYKPKNDRNYERKIKDAYINSGGGHFGSKPLVMIVISHRELPESKPKKLLEEHDTYKPDASNILKSVEDALNGIAYYDDKQIVLAIPLKAKRRRSEKEHLEIIISDEVNEDILEEKLKELL